jgi:hypothetical protein
MGDVTGISKGNYYSDRDVDALQGNEKVSTNAAINRVANHAGASEIHVLHGRDKTEGEIRSEHRDGVTKDEAAGTAGELASMGIEHIIEHVGEAEIGLVALPASLIAASYEMMKNVGEDGIVGHERAEAMPRDAMHALILGSLNGLPQGYVDGQRARLSNDAKDGSFTREMSRQLGRKDNPMMGIMQLHCDQGLNAARTMYTANQRPSEYLAANPDIAKKYTHDAAFRHGFDGAVFAHDNGQYADVMKALDQRDARYTAHHVAWRA